MSWLLRQARPYGGEPADVLVADGVVAAIGEPEDEAGRAALAEATVVDAQGLVLLPGLVDLHTHLREPGREDAETVETGTQAAALGGFTAVHAMANTDPVADTAGVVEQVWRPGHAPRHCAARPGGARTIGPGGEPRGALGGSAGSPA